MGNFKNLRNSYETSEAGFGKVLINIQVEYRALTFYEESHVFRHKFVKYLAIQCIWVWSKFELVAP